MYLDKERLAKILESKLEQGYDVIENIDISSPECKVAIINMFEINATIEGLRNDTKEAKELNDYDKEMEKIAIEKALAKNSDIEVAM